MVSVMQNFVSLLVDAWGAMLRSKYAKRLDKKEKNDAEDK